MEAAQRPVTKIKLKPRPVPMDDDLLAFPLYDLRKSAGLGQGPNQSIVEMLDILIAFTLKLKAGSKGADKANQQRRINSFIKARDAIKDYPKEIKSGSQAQKEIDGVGKGIAERIQEYLNTGTLKELEAAVSPEARTIMELTEITGIGEVKAQSMVTDHGVTSVDDLIQKYRSGQIRVAKNQLTHHIAVGLEFYHDLKQRMSWEEADQLATAVKSIIHQLDPTLIVEVCGSYRRKRPTCGDLDVLVSQPSTGASASPLPSIVTALEKQGLLVGHLTSSGTTKYMGVCRLNSRGLGRRIDIRLVEYQNLGAALLYFTGSGKFNKIMRYHALTRGYTLNEYGLYHCISGVKGDEIPAPTERDIFQTLGFVYLTPEEREFG